jgi:hypothetical protein
MGGQGQGRTTDLPLSGRAFGWCFVVVARRTLWACLVGEADKLLGELDDGAWVTPICVAGRLLPRPVVRGCVD